MSRRRVIIMFVVITLIAIAFIVLLIARRDNNSVNNIISSDVVATNIQFVDSVNHDTDLGNLYFFTGSNIAHINSEGILTKSNSSSIFHEIPFGTVSKVAFSPKNKVSIVRIEPESESQLAHFLPNNSRVQSARQSWIRVDGNSEIRLFNPSSSPIVDLYIHGEYIYSLHYRSAGESALLRTQIANNKSEIIRDSMNGNQIIGVSENRSVIVRGIDSLTVLKPNREIDEIKVAAKSVFYDSTTDLIGIYDKQNFSLLSTDSLSTDDIELPADTDIYYAGSGMVVALESSQNPEKFSFIDLEKNSDWVDVIINNESKNLQAGIESVRILEKDPLIFAVISSGQDLSVLASKDNLTNLERFRIPQFRDLKHEDYSLIYQLGHNTLRIFIDTYNLGQVRRSYKIIQEQCGCDLNQINKVWLKTPSANAQSGDEIYTGDGVPPELQP